MMSSFKLHSDDSEFNNRVDALFSSLQTAAVGLEPQVQKRTFEESSGGTDDGDDDSFCRIGGERSQKFKRPEGIPPKWRGGGGRGYDGGPRNSTPDYVKNPQKWTRYSMKDTKVLSDRENKLVGLQLFDDLRSRRQEEEMGTSVDSEESECHKIVFKKPLKTDDDKEIKDSEHHDNEDKTSTNTDEIFGGTKKHRMEEYKVGQSKPKSKNKTKPVTVDDDDDATEEKKKVDNVKLSYLMFEEEEETDD